MKTILLIHGVNLNLLGRRDARHYGSFSLKTLENRVKAEAKLHNLKVKTFQSNHEGALIDFIQKNSPHAAGIIINPGAFTHYSYALHDALLDTGLPAIEVHLSQIARRESWRKISVTAPACAMVISGEKEEGYFKAVRALSKMI